MFLSIMLGSFILLLAINMLSSSYHPQDRYYFDEYNHPIMRGHMDYREYAMMHRVKRNTNALVNGVLFVLFIFLGIFLVSKYDGDGSVTGTEVKTEIKVDDNRPKFVKNSLFD